MPKETELTAVEAARRLGVGLDYVYSLLWTQKLTGRKLCGHWKIPVEAVECRLRAREKFEEPG